MNKFADEINKQLSENLDSFYNKMKDNLITTILTKIKYESKKDIHSKKLYEEKYKKIKLVEPKFFYDKIIETYNEIFNELSIKIPENYYVKEYIGYKNQLKYNWNNIESIKQEYEKKISSTIQIIFNNNSIIREISNFSNTNIFQKTFYYHNSFFYNVKEKIIMMNNNEKLTFINDCFIDTQLGMNKFDFLNKLAEKINSKYNIYFIINKKEKLRFGEYIIYHQRLHHGHNNSTYNTEYFITNFGEIYYCNYNHNQYNEYIQQKFQIYKKREEPEILPNDYIDFIIEFNTNFYKSSEILSITRGHNSSYFDYLNYFENIYNTISVLYSWLEYKIHNDDINKQKEKLKKKKDKLIKEKEELLKDKEELIKEKEKLAIFKDKIIEKIKELEY